MLDITQNKRYYFNMITPQEISKEELLKLKGKYIFHGSPTLFDVCQPHLANCNTGKKENNQFAIYGSSNLSFSILFAFQKQPKERYSWHTSKERDQNGNFYAILEDGTYINEDAFGYLYCFEKAQFTPTEEGGHQYVCNKPLKPTKIYKIHFKQFSNQFVQNQLITRAGI